MGGLFFKSGKIRPISGILNVKSWYTMGVHFVGHKIHKSTEGVLSVSFKGIHAYKMA